MAYKGFKVIKIDGVNYRKYPSGTIKYIAPLESKHAAYKKESCVYLVTDKTNGRLYVGSTVNMRNRMRAYETKDLKKDVFKGVKFEDLLIEVLEYCDNLTTEQRLYREYEYIIKLNTIYPAGNNIQCPVRKIKFSLLDMSNYNPLTHVFVRNKEVYDKDKYEKRKHIISQQRKDRYRKANKGDKQPNC